ncbi:rhombosortase [Acinetobacter larvae]|uniref:Rhombosortase n=1 Tax=Acinetobacter larvae TaxID=1789224 RepID=A0A1B2LWG2_9GAMM|nr:rhombosortase [Acinetobacter larvae]AOA57290.1 rhombosortase [Acinetobacter larvae]
MVNHILMKRLLFVACCMVISALLQLLQAESVYWRWAFWSEPWRWWSAHWVHVNWIHYFLNIFAFICLPFIFPRLRLSVLAALLLVLPPLVSISFYYYFPEVEVYAGLSGVLHGLYIAAALDALTIASERRFALLLLAVVGLKLFWENIFAAHDQIATMIGSPVLIEAHLLGAWWGVICTALWLGYRQYQRHHALE